MKKRAESRPRRQAVNAATLELAVLVEPMLAGMTTTRAHLLAWVHAHGLAALDELFREEATARAGPKGRHQAARTHYHWGTHGDRGHLRGAPAAAAAAPGVRHRRP